MRGPKVGPRILDFLTLSLKLILNIHQAIVLDHSLSSGRSASLEMTRSKTNCQVSDEVICRFARAMGDEDSPSVAECQIRPTQTGQSRK
jgi:hypothetical protein